MKTRINGFTITRDGLKVSITPGTILTTSGIRNLSCEYLEVDSQIANARYTELQEYARRNPISTLESFWRKLNHKPTSVYLRFQRLFARKNDGKWFRGLTIANGDVSINLE